MSRVMGLLLAVLLVMVVSAALAQPPSGQKQKPVQDCPTGWAYCCKGSGDCIKWPVNRLSTVHFGRCWKWKPPGCWPCGDDGWLKVWEKCVEDNPDVARDDIYVCTLFYWRNDFCYQYKPAAPTAPAPR